MSFAAFDRGIPAAEIQKQKKSLLQRDPVERERELLQLWRESERRLGILRSFGTHLDEEPTDEQIKSWLKLVKNPQR